MSLGLYTLDEHHRPVPCDDTAAWSAYMLNHRVVQATHVGDATVSTVFLGIDHNFGAGVPLLWETMVFGSLLDEWQTRHATHAQALAMHEWTRRAVELSLTPSGEAAYRIGGLRAFFPIIGAPPR